ncbi:MAG: T9SS type A sorting domain-containing protein [Bacteroidota bacterium]|nr:T9SS type A sorting domain-containing protein [Bacteroidota bacterium]
MKKLILLLIFNCSIFISVFAQDFVLANQMIFGGNSDDTPVDIVECNNGGYYILSTSSSGISGNKTTQQYGPNDYWLIKTDSLFNVIWQLSYGGDSYNFPAKLLYDDIGNLYLCGYSFSGISGNKTVASYGSSDYWIIKIDSLGNEIWQSSYGGDNSESLTSALLFNNKLYFLGSSSSDISGTKTDYNRGAADYWLVCADTSGTVLWDKTYGGTLTDKPTDMKIDNSGSFLFLFGRSNSDATYEKTEDNIGLDDFWLLKINVNNGSLSLDKTFGSESTDFPSVNGLLQYGEYLYILGSSYGNISGDKSENSRGDSDYWLLKTDLDFNLLWDKTIGGDTTDAASTLCLYENMLLLGGNSMSNAGFEKTENVYLENYNDAWYVAIDTSGAILWDKTIGSLANDFYIQMYSLSNLIFVNASYDAYSSADLALNGYGMSDIWLFRMSVPLSNFYDNIVAQNIELYPNPVTDKLNVKLLHTADAQLQIFSIDGRLLQTKLIANGFETIDVTDLSNGVYVITISQSNRKIIKRFVVQ